MRSNEAPWLPSRVPTRVSPLRISVVVLLDRVGEEHITRYLRSSHSREESYCRERLLLQKTGDTSFNPEVIYARSRRVSQYVCLMDASYANDTDAYTLIN